MALIPGSRTCDFCKNVIPDGVPYARLMVPLPLDLRAEILRFATAHFTRPSGIFGHLVPIESMVPHEFQLEQCTGCTLGLFPGVYESVRAQVQAEFERKLAAKQRCADAAAELNDA